MAAQVDTEKMRQSALTILRALHAHVDGERGPWTMTVHPDDVDLQAAGPDGRPIHYPGKLKVTFTAG